MKFQRHSEVKPRTEGYVGDFVLFFCTVFIGFVSKKLSNCTKGDRREGGGQGNGQGVDFV